MSNRVSYFLAVLVLLAAAVLRLNAITTLPPGLADGEITDIRIAETARAGSIEVFYDLGDGDGREGLYHITLTAVTGVLGQGPLGYRMLSVWAGMLATAGIYALGRRLYGSLAGLAAMSLFAFSMWPVLLSRLITRETVIPFLVVAVLLSLTLVLPLYRRRRRRSDTTSGATALGVLLGLLLYVHPIGIVILLSSALIVGYIVYTRQHVSRRRVSYISFSLLLLLIITVPYLVSSIRRPELAGVGRLTGSAVLDLSSIFDSLTGIFFTGDANPLYNLPGRPLFDPISSLFILVGLVIVIREWRSLRNTVLLVTLAVVSPVFLLAADAPNFLNYTAALPLLVLLFGIGLSSLTRLNRRYGTGLALLILAVVIGFNGRWINQDLFRAWVDSPAMQAAYNAPLGLLARHIDQTAEETPTVVCGWRFAADPATLTASQLIRLMTNNRDAPVREVDCTDAMLMTNGGEFQQLIVPDEDVMQDAHPAVERWWGAAQPLTGTTGTITDAPRGVYWMDVEQELADYIGLLTVEAPVSYAPEVGGSFDARVNTPIAFGGNLTFLGYAPEAMTPTYTPGDIITLVTYWRADGLVPPDLQLFAHVLADPGAAPPANTDVIQLNPTRLRDRDVFVQVTYIPLPDALPTGEYAISIGAYQNTSRDRLAVLDEGEPRGTRLFLFDIRVE